MNILLIGATGQIGYALTAALARTPHATTALVRSRRGLPFPANVTVVEAGEFTGRVFGEALRGADCVIYGVGLPEQFSFDETVFERVNHGLLRSFLEAVEASSVRRLVYVSTYEVFEAVGGVIRENHPIADPSGMTPYFAAMTRAYRGVTEAAGRMGLDLTTIHPAAVYGGLNTGYGVTNVIENLLNRRVLRMPVIIPSRFPVVHADSLAAAIVCALERSGPFIVSDQMTSLKELALTLRRFARSYVPPTVPLGMAYASTSLLELLARITRRQPILARVQVDFLVNGAEPRADRARAELEWEPLSLGRGIQRYLEERTHLPGTGTA